MARGGLTRIYPYGYIPLVLGPLKRLVWMGSTLEDLRVLPRQVRRRIGLALDWAQRGGMHPSARLMKGPGLRGVLGVVDDFDGDTFRAAYIARLATAIYVLHVFKKKSTRGIATPHRHLDLIRRRLNSARRLDERGDHEAHQKNA